MSNSNGSNVKVVVRIRPQNEKEIEKEDRCVVNSVSDQVLVFDPSEDICEFNGQRSTTFVRGDITRRRFKNLKFAFDYVFDSESTNIDVYEHTSKTILDGLLNGYNCSVFAYGATGAGKTYTMLGTNNQPGITFLTLMDLYQRIELIKTEKNCEVAVSYLEVYNEQIKDLLNGRGQLPIREDPKAGVLVHGLSLCKPRNEQDLLHMLYYGNKNRTQHPTDANAESSRSHAVFQVFVKQSDRTANLVTSVHMAKLCLVDLAGSERGTVSKNNSSRMREGANINRSLLALGNVINMLADNKVKAHIPYRDSKLTRLLKDSIGGNCRTVMIAAISPSAMSYEDTYNTLKYADRAKHIRADLKKNVMSVKSHISKYGKIIEDLRQEVSELKSKIQNYENNATLKSEMNPQLQTIEESKRLQEILFNIFASRKSARKEILKCESNMRLKEWKIYSKKISLNILDWVFDYNLPVYQLKKEKGKRVIEMAQKSIKSMETKIVPFQKNFTNSEEQLQRWKAEKDLIMASEIGQSLDLSLRAHHLEVESTDKDHYTKHLKKIISFQDRYMQVNVRNIISLTQGMKKMYSLLKSNNLVTKEIEDDYNNTMEQITDDKEIMWADEREEEENKTNLNLEGMGIEKIIEFPLLSSILVSQPLDEEVKNRRQSLTPILSRTKNFLHSTEDDKPKHPETPSMLNESQVISERKGRDSLKKSALESCFDQEHNIPKKKIMFSPLSKTETLVQTESEGESRFKTCITKEILKSPFVEKKVYQRTPIKLLSDQKITNENQTTLLSSPDNLPSTRNESLLSAVGGGTITKTQPSSVLRRNLSVCKVKPVVNLSAPETKENMKPQSSQLRISSSFKKQTSTGIKKPLTQTISASILTNASNKNKSQFLSRLPAFRSKKLFSNQPRRELFRSKSTNDLRK